MAVWHRRDSMKELKNENVHEIINKLGQELAVEKLKGIEKDIIIDNLGQEVAKLKLEIIQLKGGIE